MGTRNDDISLKLAKAVKQGFLPDVSDSEIDILKKEAKTLFSTDMVNYRSPATSPWVQNWIEQAFLPPVANDTPTIAQSATTTTALTTPKVYKPLKVGIGSQTLVWDGLDDPIFHYAPGEFSTSNGGSSDLGLNGNQKPGGDLQFSNWPVIASFMTSSDVIEVFSYAGLTEAHSIAVNDKWLSEYIPTRSLSSQGLLTTYTFPTVGIRKITLRNGGNFGLSEVRVPPAHSIWKPRPTQSEIGVIVGDSFIGGAGASGAGDLTLGANQMESWGARVLRLLNLVPVHAGIGGTGFAAGGMNGSVSRSYQGRLAKVLSFNPNTVILTGSVNDPQGGAGVGAAVALALETLKDVPNVYVVGCVSAGWEAMNAIIKTETLKAGRRYIDMNAYMFGTGKIGATTGNGTNDFWRMADGTHPTYLAHKAIGNEVFRAIATEVSVSS